MNYLNKRKRENNFVTTKQINVMRINPKELRLGNWIQDAFNKETFKIVAIHEYGVMFGHLALKDIGQCVPIELTEDFLLKLGFEENNTSWTNWEKPNHTKEVRLIKSYNYCMFNNYRINYVHQLQNLYFALTGEELKLTDYATL